jgi:NADPH-dependent curcumin reductase CurA
MTLPPCPETNREIRLARRLATGPLTPEHFAIEERKPDPPAEGEVLVRHDHLQLWAVMRDLMTPAPVLPMPPYRVGERLWGPAVGTVVTSRSTGLLPGDTVFTLAGWTEYSVGPAAHYTRLDTALYPRPEHFLTQGPTAYHGMVDIARVGEGDVVFVSGAAGAVGSLAGQIARCRGARRVIGSTGSREKADYLVGELGYDAAFDYHEGPVADRLRELAPTGIDVFFDNVGGAQFEAAVQVAAPNARFALCGALSGQLGPAEGAFPRLDLLGAIVKQISLRAFATRHTPEQMAAWYTHSSRWLREKKLVLAQTVLDGGIPAVPGILIALLDGAYRGNVAVRLNEA